MESEENRFPPSWERDPVGIYCKHSLYTPMLRMRVSDPGLRFQVGSKQFPPPPAGYSIPSLLRQGRSEPEWILFFDRSNRHTSIRRAPKARKKSLPYPIRIQSWLVVEGWDVEGEVVQLEKKTFLARKIPAFFPGLLWYTIASKYIQRENNNNKTDGKVESSQAKTRVAAVTSSLEKWNERPKIGQTEGVKVCNVANFMNPQHRINSR